MTISAIKILPEVVGKALYLELTPILDSEGNAKGVWQGKDAIQQIVITPNGLDASGKEVGSLVYDRIISKNYPRAQWSSSRVSPLDNNRELLAKLEEAKASGHGRYFSAPKVEDFDALPNQIKGDLYANGLALKIKQLTTRNTGSYNPDTSTYDYTLQNNWTISKKFAVEVTDEDLSAISSWKTPQAIIRRINKVRDLA